MRSLPVPLSPWIRMVEASLAATLRTKCHHLLHLFRLGDDLVVAGAALDLSAKGFDFVA